MIKGIENYTKFTFTGNFKAVLTRRGSQHILERGDTFAIRYAGSDASKMRIVLPGQITKIYSVDNAGGNALIKNSILAR